MISANDAFAAPAQKGHSMDIRELMHSGALYNPFDEELAREQIACQEKLYDFNQTRPSEGEKRAEMLRDMFAEFGEGSWVEPPLHAFWAGKNVHFGKSVYAAYSLTLVDDTHIYVGDHTMLAPNVTLTTATHAVLPEKRDQGLQCNFPIHIGRNCWLGAGVIVLPGVTIGDNSVIGAGSVVTRDIPANVVAYGTPCKVVRPIGEKDREYYFRGRKMEE